jgi:hypothetical protein
MVSSAGVRREYETVAPLAAALNLEVDTRFAREQTADLAAAVLSARGPVLVAWRGEDIIAIIGGLGTVDPAPPASLPYERYDLVYVLTRNGGRWSFTQVAQMLLAGDSPAPIAQ